MEYWHGAARKLRVPEGCAWGEILDIVEESEGIKVNRSCCEPFSYIETQEWVSHKERKPFPEVINKEVYIIEDYTCSYDEDPEGFTVWNTDDDRIGFSGSFYNGGTCLSEQLGRELETHKPTKTILSRTYCGEDLGDMGNDVDYYLEEAVKGIPSSWGIPAGTFTVNITWEND